MIKAVVSKLALQQKNNTPATIAQLVHPKLLTVGFAGNTRFKTETQDISRQHSNVVIVPCQFAKQVELVNMVEGKRLACTSISILLKKT